MDNALPRLIDIEQLDAAGRGFRPKRGSSSSPILLVPARPCADEMA